MYIVFVNMDYYSYLRYRGNNLEEARKEYEACSTSFDSEVFLAVELAAKGLDKGAK